jgi:hypothetical protein
MNIATNESKSDWYKAETGHTVRLATQGTFGTFTGLPRGTMEQMNKACDDFFKRKGITYGESWFSQRKERKEQNK